MKLQIINFLAVPIFAFVFTSCEDRSAPVIEDDPKSSKIADKSKKQPKEWDGFSITLITEAPPDPAVKLLPVTEKIFALLKPPPAGKMETYIETIPLADNAELTMIPIPGGEFTLGSPENELSRKTDESPQRKVKIAPFWMASTEITWGHFWEFVESENRRNKDGTIDVDGDLLSGDPPFATNPTLTDAISQPTPPYAPMHQGMGRDVWKHHTHTDGYHPSYPAITMTQHAASKFCEWLTAQTGHYYRLPTEAEWEYACRAGTTTAYSFGDDASRLGEYAWYYENADETYHPVAQKKPNPWGLFDMHGNVSEWTLDAYLPDYSHYTEGVVNPLSLSSQRYPRVTRGGLWDSDAEDLRSAARLPSDKNWKAVEAQIPKSIWHHTSHLGLGFRIIRPAKNPTLEEMHLLWNTGPGERF